MSYGSSGWNNQQRQNGGQMAPQGGMNWQRANTQQNPYALGMSSPNMGRQQFGYSGPQQPMQNMRGTPDQQAQFQRLMASGGGGVRGRQPMQQGLLGGPQMPQRTAQGWQQPGDPQEAARAAQFAAMTQGPAGGNQGMGRPSGLLGKDKFISQSYHKPWEQLTGQQQRWIDLKYPGRG